MKRIPPRQLDMLQKMREHQQRQDHMNETVQSLIGSAHRATKIALWKAQALEDQNKASLLAQALRLIDEARLTNLPIRKKA